MCIATATSSHVAVMNESPRQASGANPIACSTPSTRPHFVGHRVADGLAVGRDGDIELEHVDSVAELARRALGEAQRPAGAGEHDVGTLGEREAGDAERQRRIGHHAGDHDLLAVEQTHVRRR